jgi:hypothetical protein
VPIRNETAYLLPDVSYTKRYAQLEKKPAAQIAHLVFANAESQL